MTSLTYFYIFYTIIFILILSTYSANENIQESQDPSEQKYESERNCDDAKSQIELRATVVKCQDMSDVFSTQQPKVEGEEDENMEPPSLTIKCIRKLKSTMKITNKHMTSKLNQFIILDHIYDPISDQRVSLLNPYVIVLEQNPLLQLYGLKYLYAVNAEAKEEVINKQKSGFTGCDDGTVKPTCGTVNLNGDIVPFSQGFCCSCDDSTNMKRQQRKTENKYKNLTTRAIKNIQDIIYNQYKDNLLTIDSDSSKPLAREKKNVDWNDFKTYFEPENTENHLYHVFPKVSKTEEVEKRDIEFDKLQKKKNEIEEIERMLQEHNVDVTNSERDKSIEHTQIRGGQNCADKRVPHEANPKTYHDSAHCLRFSKLWYGCYQLSEPILQHSLSMKIYEKREIEDGTVRWVDKSKCNINVGSFHCSHRDKIPTMSLTYEDSPNQEPKFSLDPKKQKILIPQTGKHTEKYLETKGGASEYLVVEDKDIKSTGDQCDKVGVGYTAFYNQHNRCNQPKGTCLNNQPSHLWKRDHIADLKGEKGEHFLKNYAKVPKDALRTIDTNNNKTKYLALDFEHKYKSQVELQLNADDNCVFKTEPTAKITEVYVDSTSDANTIITIKIHNSGLVSNSFKPRLADCPLELPADWSHLEGNYVVIAPQFHNIFFLKMLGAMPIPNFYCSVEVINLKNEVIAVRRVRIVKGDRCICSWHCLCACYETTGLGCVAMSHEHYKAAGFIGSMPMNTNMVAISPWDVVLFGTFSLIILLIVILLLLGCTKGLIGLCCCIPVGIWGLDVIIGHPRIDRYFERDYQDKCVVYDEEDWPVNPHTNKRNVRIVAPSLEFCLNVIFFFTYPLTVLCVLMKKCCCPFYVYTGDQDKGHYFEKVSTIVYSKCPELKHGSESETETTDEFEFED